MFRETDLGTMLWNVVNLDPTRVFLSVTDDKEILEFVAELNRDQLRKGINAKGESLSSIGGEYADLTLELHPEKDRFTINLFDTGEYYDSITVTRDSGGFVITSDPIKEDFGRVTNLFDRWGKDIEGLTNESLTKLIDEILIKKYVEYLETKI